MWETKISRSTASCNLWFRTYEVMKFQPLRLFSVFGQPLNIHIYLSIWCFPQIFHKLFNFKIHILASAFRRFAEIFHFATKNFHFSYCNIFFNVKNKTVCEVFFQYSHVKKFQPNRTYTFHKGPDHKWFYTLDSFTTFPW